MTSWVLDLPVGALAALCCVGIAATSALALEVLCRIWPWLRRDLDGD